MISGLTIVRNALSNGYPIAEVIDNLKLISDELIVCDGNSEDGTLEYLKSRSDIILHIDDWDLNSNNGLEFAKITNLGLSRCNYDWIFYLQADELLTPKDTYKLKDLIYSNSYNSISVNFNHIRYDFDYKLTSGYSKAIRATKKKNVHSHYDAYDFAGEINPCFDSDIQLFHFGYVFIENILRKMINHADFFYKEAESYLKRRLIAEDILKRIQDDQLNNIDMLELQNILEPEYSLIKHNLVIPESMERLRFSKRYSLPFAD